MKPIQVMRYRSAAITTPPSTGLAALIAQLGPVSWMRLNDNAGNNTVVNSAVNGPNGSFFNSILSVAPTPKNTSLASVPGLVAGDVDKAFNFSGNSMVISPAHSLSNATGWTLFFIAQQDTASPPDQSGAITIVQLSSYVAGCPELSMIQNNSEQSRFRVMRSGVSEVQMGDLPFYTYGTKLAVCLKKEAAGAAKLFVNGSKIGDSGSDPGFNYFADGVNRWCTGYFGSDTASQKYQLPGKADELTLFNRPLTDAECIQLTATA